MTTNKKQQLPGSVLSELISNMKNVPDQYKEDVDAVAYLTMEDKGPRSMLPLLNIVLTLQLELQELRKSNDALANLIADKL